VKKILSVSFDTLRTAALFVFGYLLQVSETLYE